MNSKSSKSFAEMVEKVFFPANVAIFGAVVLILYLLNSPLLVNNIMAFAAAIAVYTIVHSFTDKRIKSETRKFTCASSAALIVLIWVALLLPLSKEFLFGLFSAIFINFLTHFLRDVWKISSHVMTYTAFATILSVVDGLFIPSFVLLPLVAWSRIKLKRHTVLQILAGSAAGLAIPLVIKLIIG